ncbi:hypothetical protein ASPWEDRAFT_73382 [Aspergillus wentii DTO 134E9]|uniref:Uncharacterized protein n=1 Tax=Aspergillus wentii DTO 134E9 TaxID=1073089 RepID=A0A1L9R555_ASPWE|nr:uncharacterized protein ASPWEDRAFT_73382 [Aspergillus wentii DTO 134E9]OJJ30017.1 hypothetical protein ASPWEDRAFT_73382 [Aspergillus wentii DTO 134E9]
MSSNGSISSSSTLKAPKPTFDTINTFKLPKSSRYTPQVKKIKPNSLYNALIKRFNTYPYPIPTIVITPPDDNAHLYEVIGTAARDEELIQDFKAVLKRHKIPFKDINFELAKSETSGDEALVPTLRIVVDRYQSHLPFEFAAKGINTAFETRAIGGFQVSVVRQTRKEMFDGKRMTKDNISWLCHGEARLHFFILLFKTLSAFGFVAQSEITIDV